MGAPLNRSEIDKKYKWDLTAIYPSEDDFEADYKKIEALIKKFPKHQGTITNSAGELLSALRDITEMEFTLEKLYEYAFLNFAVNMQDNKYQALTVRMRNLISALGEATWFVSPYILKLDEKTLEKWFVECPELESFRRMIEVNMRSKPHTLSDECEMLMSKLDDTRGSAQNIYQIFTNSDLTFGKIKDVEGKSVELTDTNYVSYLMSTDRRVRQAAFRTLYKTYGQFGNTIATMFANHVKERGTLAKARSYKDSITASTFQDEVTPEIYNNLINSVHKGLPALYEYYALKRDVLGVEKLHMYDLYAPLIGSLDRKYTYEEGVNEVLETVKVFGEEYESALRRGLTELGWVDVFPSRGKRGGAFSAGTAATEPYMLLNFTETFDDISTLAHEAGHSMHSWFSTHYNEPHNSSYTIFVAEVASTVNELLLAHRKLRESNTDDEKLYILNELMETYKGTLFRQTMFAEFERDMHALSEKGTPLTRDLICKHYYKLIKLYFGKDVACDKQISHEWMRIPHFYTSFYVYKYATCISAASAIVKRIETEGDEYVSKYIDFLKCGGSKSPLDSLLVAGIDMRDPEVVSGAIEDFASCIKQFREILGK